MTNEEVIEIVASASRRSRAARLLVKRAVQAWGYKYPGAKVDDCAAICLFLKKDDQPDIIKSGEHKLKKTNHYYESVRNIHTRGLDRSVSKDEWEADEPDNKGLFRANTISKITGLFRDVSRRYPSQFYS